MARSLRDLRARCELVVAEGENYWKSEEPAKSHSLRLAIPLDDDLAPAIIEAVKERLRRLDLAPVASRSR